MFVVKIAGGLGNQLFQYCLALLLRQGGGEVALEKTHFAKDNYKRAYNLDILSPRLPLLADDEARARVGRGLWRKLRRRALGRPAPRVIKESPDLTWREALAAQDQIESQADWHIAGYWQAAEMVLAEKTLLDELRQLRDSVPAPSDWQGRTMVAVHARQKWEYDARGAKAANHRKPNSNTIWLSPQYYHDAMQFMRRQLPDAAFAVFGDDEAWCEAHILPHAPAGSALMRAGERPDWQDMLLMSGCAAVICANSSFSWWAGALCGGPVAAPAQWSKNAAQNAAIRMPSWTAM